MRGCISNCHPRWIYLCGKSRAWGNLHDSEMCRFAMKPTSFFKETRANMTEQHANQSTRHFDTAEVRSCLSTLQAQNSSGKEAFWHVNFRNKSQRGIAIFKICSHPKSYTVDCTPSSRAHPTFASWHILIQIDVSWLHQVNYIFSWHISCKSVCKRSKISNEMPCKTAIVFLSSPLPGAGSLV